jgi:hypothetical protein
MATDEDGDIYGFMQQPTPKEFKFMVPSIRLRLIKKTGQLFYDWRESLRKRPTQTNNTKSK